MRSLQNDIDKAKETKKPVVIEKLDFQKKIIFKGKRLQ